MRRSTLLWLMVACLLMAAALRLPALTETPPGAHYDEAANGILAGEIAFDRYRPLFIPSYTGKETLYFYAAGLTSRLVGRGLFALRLTSAFLGLLTVAATYRLGVILLRNRRVALIAAFLMAASFWHVLLSRLGFRAISQPLLQAAAVGALWIGFRRHDLRWSGLGGVLLGLTAYTYLAARLFPVPLLLGVLPFFLQREARRRPWREAGTALVAGVAVLAPLLLYFVRNPDAFWTRISQVGPEASTSLLDSYISALGMLFVAGDPYWRFNIPGRPLFTWLGALLLLLGFLVLLWQWRRRPQPDWRAAAVLLLATPLLMLLPTALATGEIVPSNLRAVGMLPFLFFLPALGADAMLRAAERRFALQPRLIIPLLGAALLAGGAWTGVLYFERWGQRIDLYYESDADLVAVAEFLDQDAPPADHLFVGALHFRHPTVALTSRRYEEIRWLPNSAALPLPRSGTALYVYPRNAPAPAWAGSYITPTEVIEGPAGPDGAPTFTAYLVPEGNRRPGPTPFTENFGGLVTLREATPGSGTSGGTLPLRLVWEVTQPPGSEIQPFIHLEDAWGDRWSQRELAAYPAVQWQSGDTVVAESTVRVPDGAPPGFYQLRVGFFNPENGQALGRLDDAGRYAGQAYTLEQIPVLAGSPPAALPAPPRAIDATPVDGLRLLGHAPLPNTVATGAPLNVSLWWFAESTLPSLSTRLELFPASGQGYVLATGVPVHDTYPFEQWSAPQFVIDRRTARVPLNTGEGVHRLVLRLFTADGNPLYETELGELNVEVTDRIFEAPDVAYPSNVRFGGEIALLGYDLESLDDSRYRLRVVWQALQPPGADYTVFVHLLSPDGVCCVWQSDQMPRAGTYPTTRWVAGEVVVDTYEIVLPEDAATGRYPLELGFFLADSGRRLTAQIPGGATTDALELRPIEYR